MCFYDANEMACKCWKWGHFRQHCDKDYRTGETCGMKLVMNCYSLSEKCKTCTKIDTKERAIRREVDRIRHWSKESGRSASIAKAQNDIYRLEYEVEKLKNDLGIKNSSLGDGGVSDPVNPIPRSLTSTLHISSDVIQQPFSTAQQVTINDQSIDSSPPVIVQPKQTVHVILQDSHGTFESKHPLLFTELNNANFSKFLALYSTKSGIPIQSLDGLNFEIVLSGHEPTTVRKGQDEQSWKSLMQDLTELLALARPKNPEVTIYEIRVTPVLHQANESLPDLPHISDSSSTTMNSAIDMSPNAKGKMRTAQVRDEKDEENQDTEKSVSPFTGHTINEIQEVISDQLQHNSSIAGKNVEGNGLNLREDQGTTIEKEQSCSAYSATICTFYVDWSPEKFWIDQCRSENCTSLEYVIVLTGHGVNAQATTVGEYIKGRWPESGPMLLDVLQSYLKNGSLASKNQMLKFADFGDLSIFLSSSPVSEGLPNVTVDVMGPTQSLLELGQQLAWLGSALRTSDSNQVGRAEAQIFPCGSALSAFRIRFAVCPLKENEVSCWHNLFVNPVIACGFPISKRAEEVGLEIPISIMAALGGASHAVEYNGGILLKGFSSMFVPLKRTGDSIQWHFIRKEDDSRLPFWEVEERCPGRALLDTVDLESISSTRAFLGWWGITYTHLGTADARYENIDWTATKEPAMCATFSGGSIGFQNFVTGDLKFSVGPKDSKLHISRIGPYQRIIKHASMTPVVLYDTNDRRGWLVPSSAVIAHIAQTRHSRERFSVQEKPVHINPSDPKLDIYEAAEKMLSENSSTVLGEDDKGNPNFYFRDLVLGVWSILESLMDKAVKTSVSAQPPLHWPIRKTLQGWEFMDIVEERSPLRLKETLIKKTCGGWIDLATDINAIVLFANGFEDIIKPAQWSLKGLCHMWRAIPKEKDYLAANISSINKLFEQSGSRSSKKYLTSTHLQWHRGTVLFEKCRASSNSFSCTCDRLQQILPESRLTFGTVVPSGKLEERGAVVFGQATHPLMVSVHPQPQLSSRNFYSQENCPLALQTNSPDSPNSSEPPDSSLLSNGGSLSSDSTDSGTTTETSFETIMSETKNANGLFVKRVRDEDQKDQARKLKCVVRNFSGRE